MTLFSAVPNAVTAEDADYILALQGSTGPGTGTTVKATIQQMADAIGGNFSNITADTITAKVSADGLVLAGGSGGVEVTGGPLVIPTIGRFLVGNGATTNSSGTLGWLQRNQLNITGTITDTAATLNDFEVPSDTANASGAANTPAYMGVNANFGGAGFGGGRAGQRNQITQTGSVSGGSFTAANFWMNGGGHASPNAQYYAGNFQTQIAANTGSLGLAQGGGEVNIQILSGNTVAAKAMWTLVQESGDAVQGTSYDTALGISNQGNCVGWSNGISLGRYDGVWPITTSGTIFGTYVQIADGAAGRDTQFPANKCFAGIDLQKVNFSLASGYSFRGPGWSVDGTGHIAPANAVIGSTPGGVKIDIPNQIATAAAVSAGGSGYYVGDIVYDSWGGQYEVATVSGTVVTGVTLLVGGVASSAQANPAATTGGSGTGLTLTLTWSANATLALNQTGQTTAFWGNLNANATGTSGSYDGQIKVTGGGSESGMGEFDHTAALHHFYTYDGTEQFRVGSNPGAVQVWEARGGTTAAGATLLATTSNPDDSVNGSIVAQGAGNLYFGNSSGSFLELDDPGSPGSTAHFTIFPANGVSIPNPMLSAPSSMDLDFGSSSSHVLRFMGYNGLNVQVAPTSATPAVNYISLSGAGTGANPAISFKGSDTNVSPFYTTQGSGTLHFANGNGTMFRVTSSAAVTDVALVKPASSTSNVTFQANSGGSVVIGAGTIATTATQGFIQIPNCAGPPTGTPAVVSGGTPLVFDTTDLKLYAYVGGAWKASGVFS